MKRVSESIIVDVPVEDVYRMWSNFGELPKFLKHVKSAAPSPRAEADSHIWRFEALSLDGSPFHVDIKIDKNEEDHQIAWHSLDEDLPYGVSGRVDFAELAEDETRVMVDMAFSSDTLSVPELLTTIFNHPDRVLTDELKNFKNWIERQPVASAQSQ